MSISHRILLLSVAAAASEQAQAAAAALPAAPAQTPAAAWHEAAVTPLSSQMPAPAAPALPARR